MNLTFAAQLNKMITAGLGGAVDAPETGVAVGRRVEYTSIGPAPILTFEANSELPLKALSVNIEPIQEGSGDPSPENVRPISGRQSMTVTRSGVNVWDEEWESGSYDTDGRPITDVSRIRTKNRISVVGGTSYYMKAPSTLGIRYYDINDVFISGGYTTTAINTTSVAPDNAAYLRFSVVGVTTYGNDVSINYPSTDHDYHPGTVASVEVQFGQTVYGGTVDVTTGEMVVDRAIVDMGSIEWIRQTNNTIAWFAKNMSLESEPIKPSTSATDHTSVQLSSYAYNGYGIIASLQNNKAIINGSVVYIRDDSCATAADFITKNTGQQMCYELATPITITLTPEQLTTVIGTNNVWSDANEVSLTYGNIYYTEGY